MTRRYAEFSTSLLKISESMPSARLNGALAQLQIELQNFILRLASEFAQRKDQLISLINNYDLMLSVIAVINYLFIFTNIHPHSKTKRQINSRNASKKKAESPRA